MSVLFMDSFDHYATADVLNKWTTVESSSAGQAISSGGGRRGTNGWICTSAGRGLNKAFTSVTTAIIGVAVKHPTLPGANQELFAFREGATQHVSVNVKSDGAIEVKRGAASGTLLGTSAAGVISANTFHFIEARVTVDNATGAFEIQVDGVSVLSASSQDTQNGGVAGITNIGIIGQTANTVFDDVYICDTLGGVNDDFLGDVRCDCYFPSGNGNSSGLTGSDADSTDNYLLVDETAPDADTTYVESDTATTKDTYDFPAMSHTPATINAVQVVATAKKDDAGARSITTVTRSGGADYDGATEALTTAYLAYSQIKETDPNTAALWTKTNFGNAEFGVKVAA